MGDDRQRITFDIGVGDREWLLEQVKEEYGCDSNAEALDAGLRAALDLKDLVDEERQRIRERVRDLRGDHFQIRVSTEFERR